MCYNYNCYQMKTKNCANMKCNKKYIQQCFLLLSCYFKIRSGLVGFLNGKFYFKFECELRILPLLQSKISSSIKFFFILTISNLIWLHSVEINGVNAKMLLVFSKNHASSENMLK